MLCFILNESVFVPTFRLLLYIGDNDTRTFFVKLTFSLSRSITLHGTFKATEKFLINFL